MRFHGFISRRAFRVGLGITPEWSDVRARVDLGESDEALQKELRALASVTRELCGRMRKIHVKLGLEDLRKSI